MKKNILFAQSFVALSLLTAAPVLGMDNQVIKYKAKPTASQNNRKKRRFDDKNQQKKVEQIEQQLAKAKEKQQFAQQKQQKFEQEKQRITDEVIAQEKQQHAARFHNPLLQDLQNSKLFIKQSELNYVVEVVENPLYNAAVQSETAAQTETSHLVTSEVEVINLPMPERVTNNNTNDIQENPLMASVIFPTQEKTLSWKEKFNYYTSTANQLLLQVIDELETGAFDVRYKNSFDLLEQAITTATKNNDVLALAKIAALCQQKYEIWVRISDSVAQPAAELLASHYSTELTLANNTLDQKLKDRTKEWNLATVACMSSIINTIATYQENMKQMQESYNTSLEHENKRITDLRRDVSTFARLNKTIRPATIELLTNNQLKTPKCDVHASILSASERKLNDVMESVKIIQSIKGFQLKPELAEELNQKSLTDK